MLVVYSEGDARKEEAGTGKSETGIGKSQNQSYCQGHSKGRSGNEGERQLLGDHVRSLERSPGGLGAAEHLPTCPWGLQVKGYPEGNLGATPRSLQHEVPPDSMGEEHRK